MKRLLSLVVLFAACGGKSGPAVSVTCSIADLGVCETAVSTSRSETTLDGDCTSAGGGVASACPTTNLVGTCSGVKSSDGVETIYYYAPAQDVSAAQASCAGFSGTFGP